MKKIMMIAAIAAVALTSCVKNDDISLNNEKEVNFNAVAYKTTKAPIDHAYYGTTDPSFGMFAFWKASGSWATPAVRTGATAFMDNIEIAYNSQWKAATGTYYWPLSGDVTFIGYTPYSVNTLASYSTTDGLTITDFVPEAVIANQVDLMWGEEARELTTNTTNYDADGLGTTTYNGVPVVFHHALSQVIFQVKQAAEYTGATINVTEVKLNDVFNKGTFKATPNYASTTYAPTWTASTPEDYTPFSGTQTVTTTYAQIGSNNALMLIPQDLADATTIQLTYTLTSNGVTSTKTTDPIKLNASFAKLENNKKYVLRFSISLNEVLFSPDIVAWDAATTGDVTL